MEAAFRQTALLAAVVGLPISFALFCVGLSRRRQGWLLSYFAYFLLFGFAGQWVLAVGLSPSGITQTLRAVLLTAAPAACLGVAVALQKRPSRAPFDTGALVACYVYPALVAAGVVFEWFAAGG